MRHLLNVLRFIIYIPLCLGLLFIIYWSIGHFALWLIELSLFWIIVVSFLGFGIVLGTGMWVFGFLAGLLSYVNPYKKIGGWVVIPLAIIYAIFNIAATWKLLEVSESKQLIVAIVITGLIAYLTLIFSMLISASNPKEYLGNN